ncbi:MAG: hypothetical protein M3R68_01635, partial [Acidobacteriota bacterium]|nr:hypothetical protein [Acidobacteriota bacterium]
MRSLILKTISFAALVILLFSISTLASAKGDLSTKQVRKLIASVSGFDLKTGDVRVNSVRAVDALTFEASAQIATAFRVEKNQTGQWRVAELRSAPDQWQSIQVITRALKVESNLGICDAVEPVIEAPPTVSDPSNKRARCLLAELLGIQLPSDSVRIKAISPLSFPFSSKSSAVVEALVDADFRFSKGPGGAWRVSGVRTGGRGWVDPEILLIAVNSEKVMGARSDLETIARALEDFRGQRGFYVESKSEAVLIDFLTPRYLPRVIRVDPWHHPYRYEGSRDQ